MSEAHHSEEGAGWLAGRVDLPAPALDRGSRLPCTPPLKSLQAGTLGLLQTCARGPDSRGPGVFCLLLVEGAGPGHWQWTVAAQLTVDGAGPEQDQAPTASPDTRG